LPVGNRQLGLDSVQLLHQLALFIFEQRACMSIAEN
jgi:hypothetical protein